MGLLGTLACFWLLAQLTGKHSGDRSQSHARYGACQLGFIAQNLMLKAALLCHVQVLSLSDGVLKSPCRFVAAWG